MADNLDRTELLRQLAEYKRRFGDTADTLYPQNASQYMNPVLRMPEPAIVLPATNAPTHRFKPNFIALIQSSTFGDRPDECPIKHMRTFLDYCGTYAIEGVLEEYVRLFMFKWSIVGKAKEWFGKLPPRSITSWQQMSNISPSPLRGFPVGIG